MSALIALFAAAVVNGLGREFPGLAAIKACSGREIIDSQVTLEVIEAAGHNGLTIVTAEVKDNFDRTELPGPVIIDHHVTPEGGKFVDLTCRLAGM